VHVAVPAADDTAVLTFVTHQCFERCCVGGVQYVHLPDGVTRLAARGKEVRQTATERAAEMASFRFFMPGADGQIQQVSFDEMVASRDARGQSSSR
jgi:hypothetical protein